MKKIDLSIILNSISESKRLTFSTINCKQRAWTL